MTTFEVIQVDGEQVTLTSIGAAERISQSVTNLGISVSVGSVVEVEVLEIDGVFVAEIPQPIGTLTHVTAVGSAAARKLKAGNVELTLPQVGGVSNERAQLICTAGGRFILMNATATPAGIWEKIADVALWEKGLEDNKANGAFLTRLAASFVNPYTFVPWTTADPRRLGAPTGHSFLPPNRFSGSFKIAGTTVTPLLIRGGEAPSTFPRRKRYRSSPETNLATSTEVIVPGSSLKGAVRSLHETLVGGCLRIVDMDFVPVYRDPAAAKPNTWTLAVVGTIEFGIPIEVSLCDEVVHVDVRFLKSALGSSAAVKTGATVHIDNKPRGKGHGVFERPLATSVSPGTDWVVLVTDAAARGQNHPYYAAVGHITTATAAVTIDAWKDYRTSVDGTDDVRRKNQNQNSTWSAVANVVFPPGGSIIGVRKKASIDLEQGDVVWANVVGAPGAQVVTKISLSYLWRTAGKHSLRERIPDWVEPCSNPEQLCNTCRIFGSADVENDDANGSADQRSYAGHVRIGDSVFDSPLAPEFVTLAPLGPPRLGAGQFTLQNPEGELKSGMPELAPLRNWGSPLDTPNVRLTRGRKYYWQGDPSHQNPPRSDPPPGGGGAGNMISRAEVIPAGNTFRSTVFFEGLSLDELGGLLASFQPSLVLTPVQQILPGLPTDVPNASNPAIHARLGGGKPFGFGTVRLLTSDLVVHTAASRYLGEDPPVVTIDDAVTAFKERVHAAASEIWPDLAACLQMHHVDPTKIAYPPSKSLTDQAHKSIAKTFWKNSSGHLSPLISLPGPPREMDQYMTIVRDN